MFHTFLLLRPSVLFFVLGAPLIACAARQDPNIVFILSDDYGYGSAVSYGGDPALIATPGIDRLAREGMTFSDANTPSSVCTPTRYAFLTGRYCWRSPLNSGKTNGTLDPLIIETTRPTVASMLKANGYQTAFVGKWHLGYGSSKPVDYTSELKPGPLELGFDYQFAVPQNHNDITKVFVENHYVYGLRSKKTAPENKDLGLDAPRRDDPRTMGVLTAKAIEWLQKTDRDKPFFLYFAPVAVHELITPSAETDGTTKAGPYGDFIRDLDLSVERILAALDEMGMAENTLVIFTSDNGGVVSGRSRSGTQKVAMDRGLEINGPLRGGKHDVWQGGFQVPFIARWPGRIEPGSRSDTMIGLVDIYATLADVVGTSLPPPLEAAPDSVSFLPVMLGFNLAQPPRNDIILQSSDGVYAIRQGKWKYIEGYPHDPGMMNSRSPRRDQFKEQLFDLSNDPAEKRDLAEDNPQIVGRLRDLLNRHRNQGFSRQSQDSINYALTQENKFPSL